MPYEFNEPNALVIGPNKLTVKLRFFNGVTNGSLTIAPRSATNVPLPTKTIPVAGSGPSTSTQTYTIAGVAHASATAFEGGAPVDSTSV